MTDIIIFVIEIIGTIAFAASGAMLAIEKTWMCSAYVYSELLRLSEEA